MQEHAIQPGASYASSEYKHRKKYQTADHASALDTLAIQAILPVLLALAL